MSPSIFACIICGHDIVGEQTKHAKHSWLREFRAIYTSPGGSHLSGTGRYSDPRSGLWFVPLDPTTRWDDGDHVPLHTIPVMRQRPEDGVHGFVCHDACWSVFKKAIQPDNVSLNRIHEICNSLPKIPGRTNLFWGHDYGGLEFIDRESDFPWEDRVVDRYPGSVEECRENPCEIPEIPELVKSALKLPKSSAKLTEHCNASSDVLQPASTDQPELELSRSTSRHERKDKLSTLPLEILEIIASYLPTHDALCLRFTSKAFSPLTSSQTFWASRFEPEHERGFLFEAQDSKLTGNWSALYHITNDKSLSLGLKNRKRVWSLSRGVRSLLRLRLTNDATSPLPYSPLSDSAWTVVNAKIHDGPIWRFNRGAPIMQTHLRSVPQVFSKIIFSTVNIGDIVYVSGMRFVSTEGSSHCFGYVSPETSVALEVESVKGFILAMGSMGLHALQVISNDDSVSKWIGSPLDSPITKRLACIGSVGFLKIGIDGFKIVSLAAAPVEGTEAHELSFRDKAYWYPSVPPDDVSLNAEFFTGKDSLIKRYQPLIWSRFGGPRGVYLRALTKISVSANGRIQFQYDREDIPAHSYTLGREKVIVAEPSDSEEDDASQGIEFSIDGPGGEIIQTIEAAIDKSFDAPGDGDEVPLSYIREDLHSFRVTTSTGRSFTFMNEGGMPIDDTEFKVLPITPGTTITGLYAHQSREGALMRIGVISEVIKRTRGTEEGGE